MPNRASLERILIAMTLAWAAQACSNDPAESPVEPGPPSTPLAPPGTVMQPGSPAPITPVTGSGGAGSLPVMAGGSAPMQLPGMEEMPPATPPTTEPAAPDPCKDFVVSRRRPCHDDPNPCNIDSGYPGDEYCLPPPAPEQGLQVHFGPSDYENTADVATYLLQADEEFNDYGL
ncbi:MAG TPA: hypothetical protein VK509_00350, partial [Polyangiales bacterium]|nr:hypothetical protein [Polyangiales bacterium]